MSMNQWRRYKDVLCHPGSELEKLLASGENKKAEELYRKVTREGVERGEFLPPEPKPGVYAGDGNMRGIFSTVH